MRTLKGLEDAVPVSVASPGLDGSWKFKRAGGPDTGTIAPCLDKANACRTLKQIYRLRRGGYDGRSTVPMLWDKASKDVVCNESYDIIHLFNSELNSVAQNPGLDLSPPQLKKRIGEWNQIIYPNSKRQQRGLYVSEELTIENSNKNFIKLVEKMVVIESFKVLRLVMK
ncbi:hypothetical protein GLYMA_13G126502v4 [Glycine max]|nr:hypothetical protein GLYMA_13G126502v4 [Glycine max]KAH1101196.1 hypothetical protein GYH30_036009 [Glycine max]